MTQDSIKPAATPTQYKANAESNFKYNLPYPTADFGKDLQRIITSLEQSSNLKTGNV